MVTHTITVFNPSTAALAYSGTIQDMLSERFLYTKTTNIELNGGAILSENKYSDGIHAPQISTDDSQPGRKVLFR